MKRLNQLMLLTTLTLIPGSLVAQAPSRATISRSQRGDTIVATSNGVGVWGAPHDAIEVRRFEGDTKERTFGQAFELQATPDGGVLVVDTKSLDGLIVRQFNANGDFVRNIGRRGEGPGEYTRGNLTIDVQANGTIVLRDSDRAVNRYAPDGKLLSSFALHHSSGSTNEVVAASDGSFYVRAAFLPGPELTGGPGMLRPMIRYDATGRILDSLEDKGRWVPVYTDRYEARQWWRPLSDHRVLYTRTDKVGFLLVDRSGKRPPFIADRPSQPLPYLKEERDELQGLQDFIAHETCFQFPGTERPARVVVPATKLPALGGTVDIDRRIWISIASTSERVSPRMGASCGGKSGAKVYKLSYEQRPVFAAFQADGTYLGEVRFPMRSRVTFVGNTAWAIVPDADDAQVLVKYKLHD